MSDLTVLIVISLLFYSKRFYNIILYIKCNDIQIELGEIQDLHDCLAFGKIGFWSQSFKKRTLFGLGLLEFHVEPTFYGSTYNEAKEHTKKIDKAMHYFMTSFITLQTYCPHPYFHKTI